MAQHVCPWWIGWFLASPIRRWFQNPEETLRPFVQEGMTVLEPGPGMGFFTLPLARMVGPAGRVIAVDVQTRMLEGLRRRAERAGVLDRIDLRQASSDSMCVDDLRGTVDLVVAIAVVLARRLPRPRGKRCPGCATRNPDDARFCHGCGKELPP